MASTSQLVTQEDYKQVTFVCRMCETESTCTYIFTAPIVCVDCGKRIKNLESSDNGIIVNNKKHYVCKICIAFYSSVSNLRLHLRRIHGPPIMYACTECGKSFRYKEGLRMHIEIHKKKWYQCPKCPRCFTKVTLLQKHKKYHSNVKVHICNTCGRTFSSAAYLKAHNLLHLDFQDRKCQCRICFKYFSSKMYVKWHIKFIHSNDKPYKCACGKTYKYKKLLNGHIESSKRKYPHSECDNPFLSQSGLRSSLRLYECETCKKTFKRKKEIRVHVLIHLPCKKSHKCLICGRKFLTICDLNQHETVHSSMRRYECDTCKKTFKRKGNLKRHVESHLRCETP